MTKAQELATALEHDKWHITGVTAQAAADELRRLEAENAELRRALEACTTEEGPTQEELNRARVALKETP